MLSFLKNKEVNNAGWLISGKIFQMLISLLVGAITARYLGPGNYGIINYAAAYIAFFSAICNLGINSVIVKDFVDHPDEQGKSIGTTLLLRVVTSVLSIITIISIVSVVDGDDKTIILVTILSSISLLFHVFDTFNYWFQSRYQSKTVAIITLIAYGVTAVYKITLLITQKSVLWFAFATSVDYIAVAVLIAFAYWKYNGQRLSFSFSKAKSLLSKSYHYILSGMMIAIYGQTDKFMLKHMLNETEVGYFSTATAICAMWVFVLQAIVDSVYPTIMNLYKTDKAAYEKKNRQLYMMVFYISVSVSVFFQIFGGLVVNILYGKQYLPAVTPLKIVTWYTAFSYLGVARNAWLVCENKQKYLKYMYLSAAFINVILNYLFIPILGASGAAIASLITQISTSLLLPSAFRGMRPNAKMMIDAILIKDYRNKILKIISKKKISGD